ncbi:MAG: hypothetical protein MI757_09545 [Pirellulales bacterium]|nr:hypothetical protein [Pirellulales bacterium]
MNTRCRRARGPFLAILLILSTVAAARAEVVEAVRDARADLDRALKDEQYGQGWRDYLLLGLLSDQLEKGLAADRDAVARIQSRFSNGSKTYRSAELLALRDALQAWLATLDASKLADLPQQVRDASRKFTKASAAEMLRQRDAARVYITSLDRRVPSTEKNVEWRNYLGIPHAQSQLADGKKINPILLEMIAQRHAAIAPIWNESTMSGSAKALFRIARLTRMQGTDDARFRQQLERLADSLESYNAKAEPEDAKTIVDSLSWLDGHGQVPELVSMIRAQFDRPNLYVRASRALMGANIDRTFDEAITIDDVILGTRQTGSGHVRGTVRLELIPDARRLAANVRLATTVSSLTSAYEDSVSVDTRSTMNVRATKGIRLDQRGRTLLPTEVDVTSSSDIVGLSIGRRIGRRTAERRVYERQGASAEESRRQTRARVQSEMDTRLAELINPAMQYYLREIRLPLLTSGNYPRSIRTRTTRDYVQASIAQANPKQWSRASRPPKLEVTFDLSVRMHESFGENLIAGIWPGAKVSEEKLQKNLEKLFGRSPEGLNVTDPERVWTFDFADQKPLETKFDDGVLTVTLRLSGFTVGPKAYPGMWITIRYKLDSTEQGVVAVRQGRLEIVPPGFDATSGARLGARQQVLRSMLKRRFERVFPETWNPGEIELTGTWKNAGPLIIEAATADNGWLTVGMNRVKKDVGREQARRSAGKE